MEFLTTRDLPAAVLHAAAHAVLNSGGLVGAQKIRDQLLAHEVAAGRVSEREANSSEVASSEHGNDKSLVVQPTIRLMGGDAGRALAAGQGAALRRLLEVLGATGVGDEEP